MTELQRGYHALVHQAVNEAAVTWRPTLAGLASKTRPPASGATG